MADDVLAYVANYHPLLGHLMHQTGLVSVVTQLLDDPQYPPEVEAGTVVAGLIHNILSPEPIRLYRLTDYWADKALPLFFPWQPDLSPAAINEDRAGRMLDDLHRAGPQKVLSAVMQQVIRQYALDVQHIHYDTTSKSFYGVYAEQSVDQGPQVAYGHSKDHRPDLLQLLFGVVMSRDGVLVAGEVASGNESDMTANGYWITHMRRQLGLDASQFLLYVADSAAVTDENLRLLRLFHIDLISRLPERFGLAETLLSQALAAPSWTEVGAIGEAKHAARYRVWETLATLADATYRCLVVHSDQLQAQQTQTLERTRPRARERAEKALHALVAQTFDTAAEAEGAKARFEQTHDLRYHQVDWRLIAFDVHQLRLRPGRPARDEVPRMLTRYRWQTELTPKAEAIQAARDRCGLFILITSLLDEVAYPAQTILAEYSQQHLSERMHAFLKSPLTIGAFCLKKPERLIALGYVLLMAAMIYTLLERQVRRALTDTHVEPIHGLDKRPTRRPTTWAIFTVLNAILILARRVGDEWHFQPARPLSNNQVTLLRLAGFGPDIYTWHGQLAPENLALPSP